MTHRDLAGTAAMNWGDLMAFRMTAEQLSFTRAAACLHITQPALSVRVRRLEQALGVRLLERSTRTVALTPAGDVLAAWILHTERGWGLIQSQVAATATGAVPVQPGPAAPAAQGRE